MTDSQLQNAVIETLKFEPSVDAAHIGVTAADGIVTLTGYVESYAEKIAAEKAVRHVRGVKAIAEEIQVRLPAMKKHADDEIAKRALDILKWNVAVPAEGIQVKVEHGIVTLTGEVDWQYQKTRAEAEVRFLGGVVGVINRIGLKPSAKPQEVREKIKSALERAADVEAQLIDVDVVGGRVTLTGKVHSWAERNAAAHAAWSAPGVTYVVDHLNIQS